MMMPANFTAVNSEVVYGGADLFTILADTAAPVWGAANVKQFNTNLLTILSNSFVSPLLNVTIGTMFGGNWGKDGDKLFGDDGTASKFFKNQAAYDAAGNFTGFDGDEMTFGNKVMRVLGSAAAVYTLGTAPAKNLISEKILFADGSIA
jgi:hypothetical protein